MKTLADVLDRLTSIAQSMMDSARPSDETVECPMCLIKATSAQERDPDCVMCVGHEYDCDWYDEDDDK